MNVTACTHFVLLKLEGALGSLANARRAHPRGTRHLSSPWHLAPVPQFGAQSGGEALNQLEQAAAGPCFTLQCPERAVVWEVVAQCGVPSTPGCFLQDLLSPRGQNLPPGIGGDGEMWVWAE